MSNVDTKTEPEYELHKFMGFNETYKLESGEKLDPCEGDSIKNVNIPIKKMEASKNHTFCCVI